MSGRVRDQLGDEPGEPLAAGSLRWTPSEVRTTVPSTVLTNVPFGPTLVEVDEVTRPGNRWRRFWPSS